MRGSDTGSEFRADMEGFDISQIIDVTESPLTPTADSPLR